MIFVVELTHIEAGWATVRWAQAFANAQEAVMTYASLLLDEHHCATIYLAQDPSKHAHRCG